jgi:hypothetical protein
LDINRGDSGIDLPSTPRFDLIVSQRQKERVKRTRRFACKADARGDGNTNSGSTTDSSNSSTNAIYPSSPDGRGKHFSDASTETAESESECESDMELQEWRNVDRVRGLKALLDSVNKYMEENGLMVETVEKLKSSSSASDFKEGNFKETSKHQLLDSDGKQTTSSCITGTTHSPNTPLSYMDSPPSDEKNRAPDNKDNSDCRTPTTGDTKMESDCQAGLEQSAQNLQAAVVDAIGGEVATTLSIPSIEKISAPLPANLRALIIEGLASVLLKCVEQLDDHLYSFVEGGDVEKM